MLYIIIAAVSIALGMIGMVYYKGEKACVSAYEVKILQAKIKNQEIALAYYKSAKSKGDELAAEALNKEIKDAIESGKVDEIIAKPGCVDCCIDDGFVRSLERGR